MNYFARSHHDVASSRVSGDVPVDPTVAFLADVQIDDDVLREATSTGRREGVGADLALLAQGGVSETLFYSALAARLGVAFVDGWPALATHVDPAGVRCRGGTRLRDGRWLLAPSADLLRRLLQADLVGTLDSARFCLTTPAHLASLVLHRCGPDLARRASHDLPAWRADLSALDILDRRCVATLGVLTIAFAGAATGQGIGTTLIGCVFLASMIFRMMICAFGLVERKATATRALATLHIPFYTLLVPLRHEAHMVPGLVAGLERLRYPRSKLEVLFLVEIDDETTREALYRIAKPPWFRVVLVPAGHPRTKPRALNVGLAMARGDLVTVYDAEDKPDPDQLRRAAARFDGAPSSLACLQACLRIDNGAKTRLAGMFALEYAILFEIANFGLARLGLPMALGGTSNHFRKDALLAVGGWDAWNVTEDADLGLRLARFGYTVDVLDSTTWEEAPTTLGTWFNQRRRWTKGWFQTSLVLGKGGRRVWRDLGVWRAASLCLLLVNLVIGPLVSPAFFAIVCLHLARDGMPTPDDMWDIIADTVTFSVIGLWIISTLSCGTEGLLRLEGRRWSIRLLWLLPYQMMISAAAWAGLFDLLRDPYHWRKTEHVGDEP